MEGGSPRRIIDMAISYHMLFYIPSTLKIENCAGMCMGYIKVPLPVASQKNLSLDVQIYLFIHDNCKSWFGCVRIFNVDIFLKSRQYLLQTAALITLDPISGAATNKLVGRMSLVMTISFLRMDERMMRMYQDNYRRR